MITLHTTYPDGETSEGRFSLTLERAFALYTPDEFAAPWAEEPCPVCLGRAEANTCCAL